MSSDGPLAGAAGGAVWVPAGRAEHDPQQFWLSVLAALRQADPGAVLVRPLTAAGMTVPGCSVLAGQQERPRYR